jgi:thiol-disulfide isomerase/thioredoxin
MEQTLIKFLEILRVSVSGKYIYRIIRSHPDFPSLLSVSDTLQRIGIRHAVHRIDKAAIVDLPFPYLLPVDNEVLLISNDADLSKYKPQLSRWNGVVLQTEPDAQIKDKTNNLLAAKEKLLGYYQAGLACALTGLLLYIFLMPFHALLSALTLFSLIGITTGYFLLTKKLGITYSPVEAFCNSNCDKVLKTDLKLLEIGLPEAVVMYFTYQLAILLLAQTIPAVQQNHLQILSWLSVLTIPVALGSIYYQYAIVKTWCRLCLVVVTVLVMQAILFSLAFYTGQVQLLYTMALSLWPIPILIFILVVLVVLIAKTRMEHVSHLSQVGLYGNKVKHAIPVLTHLLTQQRRIDTSTFDHEIVLGARHAPIRITMATNLYCSPCRAKHETLAELLELYQGQVCVVLRFLQSGENEKARQETVPYLLNYWLKNIHGQLNEAILTEKLIHAWFSIGDLEIFKQQYPLVNESFEDANSLTRSHYAWMSKVNINSTPTFLVNGYPIPREYSIDEIIMLAPALIDWLKTPSEQILQNV